MSSNGLIHFPEVWQQLPKLPPLPDDQFFRVDTREQKPYALAPFRLETLKTGDYMVSGVDDLVIERKNPEDLFGCITWGRERFVNELERLEEFRCAIVLCEITLARIAKGKFTWSKVHPNSVLGSIRTWTVRHGVNFMFVPGRAEGSALCEQLLLAAYWDRFPESIPGQRGQETPKRRPLRPVRRRSTRKPRPTPGRMSPADRRTGAPSAS